MKKTIVAIMVGAVCALLSACADHDDPKLAPIDTSNVKITATVSDRPNSEWMTMTEELTISVQNLTMTAPKGVVLKSVSLVANTALGSRLVGEKPYSGEALEFKVPLASLQGRCNFTLLGNLIRKDYRDAQIIIADNIQKIVFTEEPKFECEGWLYVSVKSKSTSGEEYEHAFEVTSSDHFTIPVPQSELYWTPASGEASTLEIALGTGATAWSPNTSLVGDIVATSLGHSSANAPTMKLTIPHTPGSLTAKKLQTYI
ncbi:MAG: hypothetical protein K2N16_10600, partial [Muribaculaceae bacterium]|nr:hypothetical protein [Muribaculaceae bacterium]